MSMLQQQRTPPLSSPAERIAFKVSMARWLSSTTLTRGQSWDLAMCCYLYPLPRWMPGEREERGLVGEALR